MALKKLPGTLGRLFAIGPIVLFKLSLELPTMLSYANSLLLPTPCKKPRNASRCSIRQ
jgi:hypothetical protein